MDQLARALDGAALQKIVTKAGVEAKKDAAAAAQRDLGGSFSNWRRNRPIRLDARFDHKGPGQLLVQPVRRSGGPWKVAESGRSAGLSKGRKRKGRVGRTEGFGTWTKATTVINRETPRRVHIEVRRALSDAFGG